ncbi:Dihydrodipicolinate synthase [Basidiobolus ranarum]|uniref:Dihydrodipicolinate synthase n=1 Tax=Basidiobolus ranarum TaxID=34480 RepID=A0ABR2VVJ1_9FUNG
MYSCLSNEQGELSPPKHPETTVFKSYTPRELSVFDGIASPKIFLGVKGKIYDVTAGKKFYGPGKCIVNSTALCLYIHVFVDGPYGNFAGRDASRGLAKH